MMIILSSPATTALKSQLAVVRRTFCTKSCLRFTYKALKRKRKDACIFLFLPMLSFPIYPVVSKTPALSAGDVLGTHHQKRLHKDSYVQNPTDHSTGQHHGERIHAFMTQRRETPPGRGRVVAAREDFREKEGQRPERSQGDQSPIGVVKRCPLGMSYQET